MLLALYAKCGTNWSKRTMNKSAKLKIRFFPKSLISGKKNTLLARTNTLVTLYNSAKQKNYIAQFVYRAIGKFYFLKKPEWVIFIPYIENITGT